MTRDRTMMPGVLLALLVGATSAPAPAQEPGSRQTREFVQTAGEADNFEIMEAYAALAQSRDRHVLAFARQMIHDHGETSRQIREATVRAGLNPPPVTLGAAQAPFLAALQSQRGPEFDKLYWQQQAMAHRSALVVEQRYAATGDSPVIRHAAAVAVPVIQSHLVMAERWSARSGEGS